MAPRKGRKGKVERYYWREIKRTYYQGVLAFLDSAGESCMGLLEFKSKYPLVAKQLYKSALVHWQGVHRRSPHYETIEEDQQNFLRRCPIVVREIQARAMVVTAANDHRLGRWKTDAETIVTAEGLARDYYKRAGWQVYDCERRLIRTLCAVFLAPNIQDPTDPRTRLVERRSTRGWTSSTPNTPVLRILMPDDFGSPAHYRRRSSIYQAHFEELLSTVDTLAIFDAQIDQSSPIRDYLNAHDEEVELARLAVRVIPLEHLVRMLDWTMQSFWEREIGWPDLFLIREREYRFAEVKSPDDRLSQAQMRWFEWARKQQVCSELLQIKKVAPSP